MTPVVDTCDQGHKFARLPDHPMQDGRPRCVHCLAQFWDSSDRVQKEQLIDACNSVAGRLTLNINDVSRPDEWSMKSMVRTLTTAAQGTVKPEDCKKWCEQNQTWWPRSCQACGGKDTKHCIRK